MASLFSWFEPNRKYMGSNQNKLTGRSFTNVEALSKEISKHWKHLIADNWLRLTNSMRYRISTWILKKKKKQDINFVNFKFDNIIKEGSFLIKALFFVASGSFYFAYHCIYIFFIQSLSKSITELIFFCHKFYWSLPLWVTLIFSFCFSVFKKIIRLVLKIESMKAKMQYLILIFAIFNDNFEQCIYALRRPS